MKTKLIYTTLLSFCLPALALKGREPGAHDHPARPDPNPGSLPGAFLQGLQNYHSQKVTQDAAWNRHLQDMNRIDDEERAKRAARDAANPRPVPQGTPAVPANMATLSVPQQPTARDREIEQQPQKEEQERVVREQERVRKEAEVTRIRASTDDLQKVLNDQPKAESLLGSVSADDLFAGVGKNLLDEALNQIAPDTDGKLEPAFEKKFDYNPVPARRKDDRPAPSLAEQLKRLSEDEESPGGISDVLADKARQTLGDKLEQIASDGLDNLAKDSEWVDASKMTGRFFEAINKGKEELKKGAAGLKSAYDQAANAGNAMWDYIADKLRIDPATGRSVVDELTNPQPAPQASPGLRLP